MTLTLDPSTTTLHEPVDDGTRRELLAAGAGLLALGYAGCGDEPPAQGDRSRRFVDDLGRAVRVPVEPRRIVSLHDLSSGVALLSVGAPVVGLPERGGDGFFPGLLDYDVSAVRSVGAVGEIDLEAVAVLRPDLIFVLAADGEVVASGVELDGLQRIAPTVALDQLRGQPHGFMGKVAALTGLDEEVAGQRARYERELAGLRDALGARAAALTVAELLYSEPNVEVYPAISASAHAMVLRALGTRLPSIADDGDEFVELSAERLGELKADVILYYRDETLTGLELWPRLAAVRAGQAHRDARADGTGLRGGARGDRRAAPRAAAGRHGDRR